MLLKVIQASFVQGRSGMSFPFEHLQKFVLSFLEYIYRTSQRKSQIHQSSTFHSFCTLKANIWGKCLFYTRSFHASIIQFI